jgi:hypothetical protein
MRAFTPTAFGIALLAALLAVHSSCTDGGGLGTPAGTDLDTDTDTDTDADSDTDPGDCPVDCLSVPACEAASGVALDEHWCGDMQGDCDGVPTACEDIGTSAEVQQFGCCLDGISYWCHEGELWQLDCDAHFSECGYNAEADYMDCVDEAPDDFLVCCDTDTGE